MEDILDEARKQAEEILILAEDDLKSIKTGRAKPSLIEDLKVQAYETTLTLKEMASISAPDPHQLIVSPWDKNILEEIEKAIAASELNLTPIVDEEIIRIKISPLTSEGRKQLVRLVKQKLESAKQMLRQVRNETKSKIEGLKGQSGVSEDDIHQGLQDLQKLVDEFGEKLERLGEEKEKELLEI